MGRRCSPVSRYAASPRRHERHRRSSARAGDWDDGGRVRIRLLPAGPGTEALLRIDLDRAGRQDARTGGLCLQRVNRCASLELRLDLRVQRRDLVAGLLAVRARARARDTRVSLRPVLTVVARCVRMDVNASGMLPTIASAI